MNDLIWIYFKTRTGTWLPTSKRFSNKDEAIAFIKLIKTGSTRYNKDLVYKAAK